MGLQRRALCRVVRHPEREDLWVPKVSPAFYPMLATQAVYGPGAPPAWALVYVNAADLTALAADPDVFLLPEAGLDLAISSLGWPTRQLLWTRIQELTGLSRTQLGLTDGNTFREALHKLGRLDNPAFNLDRFYVDP